MKKPVRSIIAVGVLSSVLLSACNGEPDKTKEKLAAQNKAKLEQSSKVMESVGIPNFNYSVERENIAKRLKVTNDPNLLQWIYPMSAGRVIGRFPVRGKVTSGEKRLTSPEMTVRIDGGEFPADAFTEAPDEMGTYGSSGQYIFWFDPAGQYHQHKGDYFLTTEPYKLDVNSGTVSVEIDQAEVSKIATYDKQTKEKAGK